MKCIFKFLTLLLFTGQVYALPILPIKPYQLGYPHEIFLKYSEEQSDNFKKQYQSNLTKDNDVQLLTIFKEYQRIICEADNDNCNIKWNIIFLKDTQEDAFANYDGTIFIEEKFKNSISKNELYFVLAHEMGHVALRHANEEFSLINAITFRGIAKNPEDIQNDLNFDYGLSLKYADFIEDQELEADKFGLYLMSLDNQNVEGAKIFIDSLKDNNSLNVHSNTDKRKRQINELIKNLKND